MDNDARVALHRRRRKKSRAAGAPVAALPDDLIPEILVRVEDGPALFRCALACKQWRDLVADPSFLRRRWPKGRSRRRPSSSASSLSNGPIEHIPSPRIPSPEVVRRAFVPPPRSPLGPGHRSLGSFIPCVTDNLDFDDAEPLVARHGLLLVRLVRRRGAPADDVGAGRALVHLAVCSLLAGTCDLLPPLKCRASSTINKCAILTHTDSCSNGQSPSLPLPSFSQVLVIVFNGASRNYNLCTFSSAEWNWSPPPRNCFSDPELRVADGSAVICQGMACWLVSDTENFCTLDVGAENGQFFLRDLPAPPDHGIPLLSVAIDGTLSMLLLDVYCCWLEIWWLQGGEESGGDDDVVDLDWLCATVIELKPPKFVHMTCLCVGERSSTLLVMDTLIRSVCFVDIETGAVDEVTEQFRRLNLETAVPFEMDWPVFFLSRLEGPRAKVREPMRLPEFFGVHFELVNPDLVMLDDKR
ncbi:hypothetical protein ACQ4PT_066540 [Festuca glaucescens]